MYIAGHVYVVQQAFKRDIDIFQLMQADIFRSHNYSAITEQNYEIIESEPYMYLHLLGDYHIHFGNRYQELKAGWVYQKMGIASDTWKKMHNLGYNIEDSKRGICHSLVEYVVDIYLERNNLCVDLNDVKLQLTHEKVNLAECDIQSREKAHDYINRVQLSESYHEILARAAANKFFKTKNQEITDFFYDELLVIYHRLDEQSVENELRNNIEFIKRNIIWKS
ncbi:hypothetical protein ACS25C_06015 [Dickeya undicola]|uniref:hypothetical protein n=1 Tax=Dickeya undicola TaxID=1577887 RepID=UPI003F1FE1B7